MSPSSTSACWLLVIESSAPPLGFSSTTAFLPPGPPPLFAPGPTAALHAARARIVVATLQKSRSTERRSITKGTYEVGGRSSTPKKDAVSVDDLGDRRE